MVKPAKVGKVMKEFAAKTLHSGSKKGPKVTSRKQAVAIAMSEAGIARPASGVVSGRIRKGATNAKTFAGRRAASHAKIR